ncbi:hypothetical protein [Anderseniella sp. Alg231-50]|uniref:hypothetical protein n=1 Tax=Anderseniella sp. Alg231-50 TaxID=1922226 RepID=UPI00307C2483
MKSLQICLLVLLAAWQGWMLSGRFDHDYDLRPIMPSTTWQASGSDPEIADLSRRPVRLGTLMSAAVFSPTRQLKAKPRPVVKAPVKPVITKPPKPVQPQSPRAELRLEGVLMSSSEQMALVRKLDTEERKWIRLGEKFMGWTLIEISALEIMVESGKHQKKLPLYVDNK